MQAEALSLSDMIEQHARLEDSYVQLRTTNQSNLANAVALSDGVDQLNQALKTQRQMQAELLVMAKNVALGSLVAGVSHELNTPIGNCLMAASTIQYQLDELRIKSMQGLSKHEMASFVQSLRTGADILVRNLGRVAKLMGDFKKITTDRSSLRICDFDLHDAVDAVIASKSARKNNHRIENHVPPSLTLNGYLNELSDVISELLDNALRHGFRDRPNGIVIVDGTIRTNFFELTVIDNGCGILPEHLERIFDPFFTTTLGQGRSGLGLHAAYMLICTEN